ncbi:MAG TPA: hypothetical protein VLT84_08740, partial [Acidobacteriota bacterium]|nr:hypothetical protein [Acidobacteriota bacterium]
MNQGTAAAEVAGGAAAGTAARGAYLHAIEAARDALRARLPFAPEVGLILGTGLGQVASAMNDATSIP